MSLMAEFTDLSGSFNCAIAADALMKEPLFESDVSTFKAVLKKQNVPDFTIICGEYSWKVHSYVFASKSDVFKKIVEEREGNAKPHVFHGEDPGIIAHLILWCYTSHYGKPEKGVTFVESPDLEIFDLMKPGTPTEDDETEDDILDQKGWNPKTLHAKMYMLASKYEIPILKKKAALEIEFMLREEPWERGYSLPLVAELFALNDESLDRKSAPGAGPQTPPQDDTPTANSHPESASLATNGTSAARQALCPNKDATLWNILVKEVASEFSRYKDNATFQKVMIAHPQFQSEITTLLQKQDAEMQRDIVDKNKAVNDLGESVKPKKGRKRKQKEMSTS